MYMYNMLMYIHVSIFPSLYMCTCSFLSLPPSLPHSSLILTPPTSHSSLPSFSISFPLPPFLPHSLPPFSPLFLPPFSPSSLSYSILCQLAQASTNTKEYDTGTARCTCTCRCSCNCVHYRHKVPIDQSTCTCMWQSLWQCSWVLSDSHVMIYCIEQQGQ